jgi:hypothetical protein
MRLSDENTREGRHLTPEERIALQAEEIKQLWQENEQLQAQVARVKKVLRKVRETLAECIDALELCTHSELCKIVISPYDMINDAKQTLAEIDKVIGGKEE